MTGRPRSRVAVHLWGWLEVLRDGAVVPLPPSRKTRALLAYLALVGRPQRRDHLCAMFWDVADDPRGALRWSLCKLRSVLDTGGRRTLIADRDHVSIDAKALDLDMQRVREATSGGVARLSRETLAELTASFRGAPLEDLGLPDCPEFQSWYVAEREDARRLQSSIVRTLIDRLEHAPAEAVPYGRSLVRLEPLDESARVSLIRLLVAAGRPEEARAQYAVALHTLERGGVAPGPELVRLAGTLHARPTGAWSAAHAVG